MARFERSSTNERAYDGVAVLLLTLTTPSVSVSREYEPIMWSSACTRLTSATLPEAGNCASITYRSDGPMTTLSTNASRSNFPASPATTFMRTRGSEKDRL